MYDMYHWHRIDAAADDAARHTPGTATSTAPRSSEARTSENRDGDACRTGTHRGTRAHRRTPVHRGAAPQHTNGTGPGTGLSAPGGPAVQAVQVALDRRDNGGDLAATRDE